MRATASRCDERQGLRDGVHRLRRLPHHPRRLRHAPSTAARDAFVTKLNASGSALAYSTFLGGTDNDGGEGIAVDGSGRAYVTG